MRRRNYVRALGLLGATTLAGCTSGSDTEEAAEATDTAESTEANSGSDDSSGSDDETEEATETEEQQESAAGEPEITIQDHELVVDEKEYTTDVYVAATVENTGDAPSGSIELTADWYDADGNYLDNDSAYLQSLGAGETWAARVYFLGADAETVDDYEFGGEYDTEPPRVDPDGLDLVDTEMKVGEDEVVITGTVANERDEAVSYAQANSKVYDGDGVVIGGEWTNVSDLPAGEEWAFELTWRGRDRVDAAADHEVWISDTAF